MSRMPVTEIVDDAALRIDDQGTIRIGRSRITLDVIVENYESGATPEAIAAAYDVLSLADVYSAIGYYLRHQVELRAYLDERQQQADELRQKIEAERPRITREELIRRRQVREQADASAGQ
jgi:uncharacterized protein (DUF433 family)